MNEFLVRNNFLGKDGFIWWIGQIPDVKAWPPQNGGNWGVRYKVRIMGYHPYNREDLSDDDLPWAHVMLPPGSGTGSTNSIKQVRFNPGDIVMGFFLDGENAQQPVIMGAFANSKYKELIDGSENLPFTPFSGYNEYVKKPPKGVLATSEIGDNSNDANKSPTGLSPADAKRVDPNNPAAKRTSDGKIISSPCGSESEESKGSKKVINEIKNTIQGYVQFLQDLKAQFDEKIEQYRDDVDREIDILAEKIATVASTMINGIVNFIFQKLIPILGQGLKLLYDVIFAKVLAATGLLPAAHAAGVAAQTAMIGPVKILQDLIPCIQNQIKGKVKDLIKQLLKSIADNVLNFVDCVADQTVGAMLNGIIGLVDNALLPAINGVGKILQFFEDFSVEGLMRNGIDALLGLVGLKSCSKTDEKDKWGACKYRLGYGPVFQDDLDLKGIVDNANTAKAVSTAARVAGFPLDGVQDIVGAFDFVSGTVKDPNFIGDLGSCYTGPPVFCGPPKINIFGGGGTGASAVPILGALVGEDRYKTGSIISVKITNPGSGYTFPPFVDVVDSCGQGYGAVARAIVKNGQVDTIYVVSEGENYPVEESIPYVVESVSVINPGQDFEDGDTVVDNQGNEYDVKIQSGSIIKVTPINSKDVTNIPVLEVISKNGSGAILAANLGERPPFDGEVKRVIDCVT